ncbi:MAG TPA: glycosyltransferase family 2 protein [Polyangiaceae bacterium]|nr:glycosyltransferase family 2 protein [Polyangiaceae bacterium]
MLGLVSIVIPNYNYAEYLAAAVESALALDWPEIEVIVVDDGSTDGSRAVIEGFGERVVSIYQANLGQRAAYNAGFAKSRGELVIFLDADDLLHPTLIRKIADVWRAGLSKVQVQMRVVDAQGADRGSVLPQYDLVPTAPLVKRWMTAAADYPTPPGSANAYARAFLEQIFPLAGEDEAGDSYCVAAAPFLGDVVTIPEPLVSYRVHGRNAGAMSRLEKRRFNQEVRRALARFRYAQAVALRAGVKLPDHALARGLRFLPYRLASLRLAPATHPLAGDSKRKVLVDAVLAALEPQGFSARSRAALFGWLLASALAPASVAEKLILWRFVASSRPHELQAALRRLRIVRGRGAVRPNRAEPRCA